MNLTAITRSLGFDVRRLGPGGTTFRMLEHDLPRIVTKDSPLAFDIGANKGQTIEMFLRVFQSPKIYSFEPSGELADELRAKYGSEAVVVERMALGGRVETRLFIHYENNELSSFLPLSREEENPFRDTKEHRREVVTVETVASYVAQHGIRAIDLLKIDTQGFDFEVLKGAEALLDGQKVRAVLIELNFSPLYSDQCGPGQIIDWLRQRGYSLIGLYEQARSGLILSWATALFLPHGERK